MKRYIYIIIIFALSFAGFSLYENSHAQKSIYVVSMTPDEMTAALKNKTISGFISWEPIPAKAVVDGYGRYLVNSTDMWNHHPSCGLAISEYLKDENMIKALVWVHIKSTRFINDPANHEKVITYGSEFTGVDRAAASAAINNTVYIEFPDMAETEKGFEILDKAGAFKKSLASIGYNDTDEFLSGIILDRYYNEVKKQLDANPDWVPPAVNGSLRFGFIDGNIHYLEVYVAQKEGYFERIGLTPDKNLQFQRFRNGLAITNAFDHREVDVATLGMSQILRYRINDNGRVYIINGVNSGGTSLVVRADSDIRSINDLSGSTIATPGFGSVQDVVMRKMFEGFEIKTV
ncbi:MAG: ABC transporter substrate-binding protein [Candidatus Methanoperedens sp.]|nr:ABC transporter substrate-binding protein [Candidatus Methanoperedens sp.]MCZ7395778.1 ABC transporter substrate-binding protein [Candidatus Methanoperedens sp.]